MKKIKTFAVGDSGRFSKTVSESDIYLFAGITGDMNPAHIDEEYARNSVFKERIAHGMLTAGFISAVIAMKMPGPGTIYKEQTLSFLAPVRIGDTITAEAEIVELEMSNKTAKIKTTCTNQAGGVVLQGFATVLLPRKRKSGSSGPS